MSLTERDLTIDIVHLVANFSRRDGELVGAISSADGSVSALVQLYVIPKHALDHHPPLIMLLHSF